MQDSISDKLLEPVFSSENGTLEPSSASVLALNPSILSTPANPLPPQVHLFKSQIILNPTISRINFVAYLLYIFFMALILVPVGLLQLPLLGIIYGLSSSDQINVITIVQVCQSGLRVLYLPWLGVLCDRIGRKPFVIAGAVLLAGSIAITPNLPNVFPYFYLVLILQDFGMCCMATPPLLADYIDYETKGRVAGLGAVIASVAAFISSMFIEKIDLENNIPSKFYEIAIAAFVIGCFLILGLKGGSYHKALYVDRKAEKAKIKVAELIQQENQSSESRKSLDKESLEFKSKESMLLRKVHQNQTLSINEYPKNQVLDLIEADKKAKHQKVGIMTGFREAKTNPWILTGYIGAFLSSAEIVLVNSALVNYVIQLTGSEDGATQAYVLTNKQILVAVFSGVLFGFSCDKYNKFKIIIFVIFCSIAAVLLLILSPTPYNFIAYLSMLFFGISLSGFLTFVNQLLSKYANPRHRASVGALSNVCSTIGGSLTSILGIFLSKFDVLIPFYLYLGSAVIGFIILVLTYFRNREILSKL